jgi:hypothetical protein
MRFRRAFTISAIAVLLVACSDATGPDGNEPGRTERFDWSGQIAPGQTVEIRNIGGDVRASRSADGMVRVVARKRGERDDPSTVRIDVVETEQGVTLCAIYPDVSGREPNECLPGLDGQQSTWANDVQVTFDVEVPAGCDFVAGTIAGSIEATGLDGDVVAGSLYGDIDISTSGLAEGNTFYGDVTASIGKAVLDRDLLFVALNGNVTVRVPTSTNAEIWGSTGSGSISTDFPLSITRLGSSRQLRGTLGSGGRALRLTTLDGNIALRSN